MGDKKVDQVESFKYLGFVSRTERWIVRRYEIFYLMRLDEFERGVG